jgi:cytochrome c551/c552
MSRSPEPMIVRLATAAVLAGAFLAGAAQASDKYPGIGRAATPSEVAAWDIDVRPDFKGLPAGSGSVAQGMDVWEAKCASCHGVFGESNQVFSPLAGGTTADDIKTGRVARLTDQAYPGRTTLMKVPTLSTLWDYINRAMPWNQPKSLTKDEVYAVLAYLLSLGNVVPDNFTLSDKNMAEVQARMPNRNGMTTDHAMWPGPEFSAKARPDVQAKACMRDCAADVVLASSLPDFARNQHGNLAEQNRLVGPQRGADTTRPEVKAGQPLVATATATATATAKLPPKADAAAAQQGKVALALATKHNCLACHGVNQKIVGPAFTDVAKKHAGNADYLVGKIRAGGTGVWGPIPMPAQTLSESDARIVANWIASGAAR